MRQVNTFSTLTQGHPQELTTRTYAPKHTYVWVKMWKHHLKTHFVFYASTLMTEILKQVWSIILHLSELPFWKAYSYSCCAVQIWYILTNRKTNQEISKLEKILSPWLASFMTSKSVACGYWKVGPISPKILEIFNESYEKQRVC